MTSRLFYTARGKLAERDMGRLLSGTFAGKARQLTGVYLGNGRVMVEGEEYSLQALPSGVSNGDVIAVQNVGRRANAEFVAITGGGSVGGSSGGGGGAALAGHQHTENFGDGGVLVGYAPAVHGHEIGAITGLQTALDGKAASSHAHAWADITSGLPDYVTRWPAWGEVTSKPSTFPPDTHAHAAGDITSGLLSPARGGTGVDNGANLLTVPTTGTAALLGTAQTFTQRQTVSTTGETPLVVRSSFSYADLRIGNDTLTIIDFRNFAGDVLRARLQHTASTNVLSVQARGTSGIIQFSTATSGGTLTDAVRIDDAQRVGIGTTAPTALLDINSNTLRLRTARTPASAAAAGNAGDICWDANYVYVAVSTNTWKRAALSTW